MSRRWLTNFIAVCIVVLYCAALLILAGCAGQGVKLDVETSGTPCGTKKVKFSTDYQVEELEIGRTIEGGGSDSTGAEGCGGGYTVSLGKGTTKDAEFEIIGELVKGLLGAYGIPVGGAPAPVAVPAAPGRADEEAAFRAGFAEGRRIQTQEFNEGRQ